MRASRSEPGLRDWQLPPLPPRRNGRLIRHLAAAMLRLLGWRQVGDFPNVPRIVLIGAPHTSNVDFVIAMAFVLALDLKVTIFGKDTLFKGPFGFLMRPCMRWCGIVPVDRSTPHGVVGRSAAALREASSMAIGLAPEGTRSPKPGAGWRTGFWRIAREGRAPILPVALDYAHHAIRIGPLLTPSDDLEADFAVLSRFYAGVQGARRRLGDTIAPSSG
jgi:1-acyl-sn-glycerol-3-phosphate acyltransferase